MDESYLIHIHWKASQINPRFGYSLFDSEDNELPRGSAHNWDLL